MSLFGKQIKDTYKSLLRTADDANGITGTLQNVEDGEGTTSPLQLSDVAVNVVSGFSVEGVKMSLAGATDGQLVKYNAGSMQFEPSDILDGGSF